MALEIKNKIVFITGASSGIGAACAECFAKEGANLIITARRIGILEKLAKKLMGKYSINVLAKELDVSKKNDVDKVISSLDESWNKIDILINNAGVSLSSEKLQDTPVEKWDQMIDVNIKGLLYVTKAILPSMLERNTGHILNIGSLASHYIFAGANIYAATKQAVKAISQTLRIDLLGTPIRVSQIDPGATKTELSEVRWGDKKKAEAFYEKMIPLDPMDIAEAVLFCATRKPHINIDDIIVNNIDMAGTYNAHKGGKSSSMFD